MGCRDILLNHINKNPGWHKKVELYVIAEDWDAETVARDLRDMETDKEIQGGYYKAKRRNVNLKKYSSLDTPVPQKRKMQIIIKDGVPTATYE